MPEVFRVFGLLDNAVFQQCTEAAAYCRTEYSDVFEIHLEHLLPYEFEERRSQLHSAGKLGDDGATWRVIVEHQTNGTSSYQSGESLIAMLLQTTDFRLFDLPDSDPRSYQSLAHAALRKSLKQRGHTYCWMVVTIDGVPQPKMVFELFSKQLPRTCQNFLHLCRGDLPDATDEKTKSKIKLSYKGSTFFRTVANGWVQGGDIVAPHRGNGGYSCYGRYFPCESFDVPHDAKGIVGMCNDGEGTNASSFYITLTKSSWMNQSYSAFGRVVEGLGVLDAIGSVETFHNQSPKQSIVISDCGELELQ